MRVLTQRMQGQPYYVTDEAVRNQFTVRILNKRREQVSYTISLDAGTAPSGLKLLGTTDVIVPSLGEMENPIILTIARANYSAPQQVRLKISEVGSGVTISQNVEFLGPDLRYFSMPTGNPSKP
jgi:hypothetical protein